MHYEKFADGTVKCIEDEIPFELPQGWAWCRISNIAQVLNGDRGKNYPAKNKLQKDGIPFISALNIEHGTISKEKLLCLTKEQYNLLGAGKLMYNDIVYCIRGSLGKCGIYPYNIGAIASSLVIVRSILQEDTIIKYIYHYLCTELSKDEIGKYDSGSAQPNLAAKDFLKFFIPLPPLSEMGEILNRIDDTLNLIDSIEKNKDEAKELISVLKTKILDLAIRGKLVPQNPDDEPASVLLERIRAEKEELIKQGKIKRDKKESIIFKGEDNSYYENLSENWCISCLAEITNPSLLNDGDWILSENMDSNGTVKLIQLGSIGYMNYINKGFKFITDDTFADLSCTQIYPSYLLINRIINDRMCLCILPNIDGKLITTVDTCWIAPNPNYDIKYLMYAMASPQFQTLVMQYSTGVTRKRISKNNLIKLPFPLPPLTEQKRIVEQVDTLLEIINAIEKSLN